MNVSFCMAHMPVGTLIWSRIGLKNDIMISLLARNCADYEKQMEYQPFYQNIEKEGVKIYG